MGVGFYREVRFGYLVKGEGEIVFLVEGIWSFIGSRERKMDLENGFKEDFIEILWWIRYGE